MKNINFDKLFELPKTTKYIKNGKVVGIRVQKQFDKNLFPDSENKIAITRKDGDEKAIIDDFIKRRENLFKKSPYANIIFNTNQKVGKIYERLIVFADRDRLVNRENTSYAKFTRMRSFLRPELNKEIHEVFNKPYLNKIDLRQRKDATQYKKSKNKVRGWFKDFADDLFKDEYITRETIDCVKDIFIDITTELKTEPHIKKWCPPEKILEALNDKNYPQTYIQLYVDACLEIGGRRNEMVAIRTGNIDFDKKTITIEYGWNNNKWTHRFEEQQLKTDYSRREIPVTDYLLNLFRVRILEDDLEDPKCFIFHSKDDKYKPISTTKLNRDLGKFMTDHGISKDIKTHALRHINCSLLVANAQKDGLNIKDVANRLGHKNPSTTLNIYTECTGYAKANNIFKDFRGGK